MCHTYVHAILLKFALGLLFSLDHDFHIANNSKLWFFLRNKD